MAYPTSYDSDTELLGNLVDQRTLVLSEGVEADDTTLSFETLADLPLPTYIRIGTELVYAPEASGYMLINCVRGVLGTSAAIHTKGTGAYVVLTSEHFNRLRDRALATQRAQGLVGLLANRPLMPKTGEVFIATDTQKVYVCTQDGEWTYLGGLATHAESLEQGETDDHMQYHTQARTETWHASLSGEHVIDGDLHDHRYGGGVGRVRSGLAANLPVTYDTGSCYYATDTKELYVALSSTAWGKVTGAPAGTIIMMMESDLVQYGYQCPPGWTRYLALDGKFPMGAPAGVVSPLNSGGANTHVAHLLGCACARSPDPGSDGNQQLGRWALALVCIFHAAIRYRHGLGLRLRG